MEYKSGFIAVMGRPNVGKSTLLNRLLGQTIAAVSPKPQTTRLQQLGILTLPQAQLVFIDTPGLHRPHHKLGEFMNQDARQALEGADLALLMLDASDPPEEEDQLFGEALHELESPPPTLLVLNKLDRVNAEQLEERKEQYQALLPTAELIPISAATGENLDQLKARVIDNLPEGPQLYPEDQVTDLYEREIAADLIRAAAMNLLQEELPHVIAIRIDEYQERDNGNAYIEATIFVERDSQKGILIGEGGSMIKAIGTAARKEIEAMSGRGVFLRLRVKVKKNWRNDPNALRLFGFKK
ncbi:MAG: GTPase Era [Anaerolineales bacterium]